MSDHIFFETLLLKNGNIELAPFHIKRVCNTLEFLNWPKKIDDLPIIMWWQKIIESLNGGEEVIKITFSLKKNKLVYQVDKRTNLWQHKMVSLKISPNIRDSSNSLWQYKWGGDFRKKHYEFDLSPNDDLLFVNEKGNICETTIANFLFLDHNTQNCFTPPLTDGLLAGTTRATLIEKGFLTYNGVDYPVIEKSIAKNELINNSTLLLCNAVRGIYPAILTRNNI